MAGLGAAYAASLDALWGGTVSSGVAVRSGVATAGAVGGAAILALPVVAGGPLEMNIHRKHQVEAEFTRRRLVPPLRAAAASCRRLVPPLTLAPGQTAQGSFFFRITPSPQRLDLRYESGNQSGGLRYESGNQSGHATVDLAPLAGLHLKAPAPASAAKPADTP